MTKLLGALLVSALVLAAPGASAQDTQTQFGSLSLSSDEPIQIESDRFEVDENKSLGTFTGNVTVVQGPTTMKAAVMNVYYRNDGGSATAGSAQIDRIEAEGGVYIKSETQVATGDRGTFDMGTEVLVLSGDEVVLSEGDNVIVGCKLTVQMKSGQATLESCKGGGSNGRVKMLLTPSSENRQ
ncbi:LptA/OstA family protein [Chelativorans sp. AA-79]|uniref:LptA/OstA family protein n=1 Tax=Chelativorans sp. AA-79 TaxID=3028735 RepID=UPI0023F7B5A9|nr:LptA/OstA family protein [Chelativorans sp. AA-79]WEX09554.1 LptA/OstA family protein [Chelativorans sp. AA-79]